MALSKSTSFLSLIFPFHKHYLAGKPQNPRTVILLTARSKPCVPLRTISCVAGAISEDGNIETSSPSTSISSVFVNDKGNALPRGAGEGVKEDGRSKLLQVVLVSPQIPGNTGCIARTCAASAVGLHLVGPLGFQIDDARVKRAGLDYWPFVVVKAHNSWAEFQEYFRQQEGEKRMIAFTKKGTKIHSEFSYRRGDYLLFGSETSGLPPEALADCRDETYGGGTLRIPMVETYVRCLNLSVSVGIALYEASRQLNYEQIESESAL